ncbi:MAG: IPT/TIG domain-containing protein [Planctomycetes bacterium]|nr:IPT/TIG domain-containing protein [Planctomycetota bacterium]
MSELEWLPRFFTDVKVRASAGLVAWGLLASSSAGQATWTELVPGTRPGTRMGHAMAYDAATRTTILLDGYDPSAAWLADTWEWNGSTWTQLAPAHMPFSRSDHAMVYDAGRRRIVLFGGTYSSTWFGDTWEWDGADWVDRTPAVGPSPRSDLALAYDSARGVTVLFGGTNGATKYGDTWEWNGTSWTQRTPATSPAPRSGHAMAYDASRGRTVLFGGVTPCSIGACAVGETWEWDGTTWTRRTPTSNPPPRPETALVYDPFRARAVLFGGSQGCGIPCYPGDDTWLWDGIDWSEVQTPQRPLARASHAMTFDETSGQVLLFGGQRASEVALFTLDDTWQLSRPLVATSLAPTNGSESGGNLVNVFAAPLTRESDTSATFGGVPATIVAVRSDHVLVRTPPGAGTVDVVLRNSNGSTTLPAAYSYVSPTLAARFGNVNVGLGDRENVLLVNGNVGDLNRVMTAQVRELLYVYLLAPSSRVQSRDVVYAWLGAPDGSTLTMLPRGLGAMVFPTPFAGSVPQPSAIGNTLGHHSTLGAPTFSSSPAPSELIRRAIGPRRPVTITFQGLIEDDGSSIPEGISVTNAVILIVR